MRLDKAVKARYMPMRADACDIKKSSRLTRTWLLLSGFTADLIRPACDLSRAGARSGLCQGFLDVFDQAAAVRLGHAGVAVDELAIAPDQVFIKIPLWAATTGLGQVRK
jgi:hypothetical protein